ncbi:MAG: ribosome silencing factor [Armatimonadota bacterium]|nr:ribosome silencing factor [Armatimonadota bacterium]
MRKMTTEQKLKVITKAATDKKAEDIQTLDLQGRTLIADYFVVCSGNSDVHIKAIVDGILDKLGDRGMKHPRVEGYAQSKWVLIDAGDVVAHIFASDEREFYDLEAMWRNVEATLEAERPAISENTE